MKDSSSKVSAKKKIQNSNNSKFKYFPSQHLYERGMMTSPPRAMHSLQDFIPDERCDYCNRVGKKCLNQHFGRFCVAVVYRYYRNNRNSGELSQEVAVDRFKLAFKLAYDRDMFKAKQSMTVSEDVKLPGCLEA